MPAATNRDIRAPHALRALPLILALAAPPVFASEAAAVTALFKQMQEHLTRLEQRKAEPEQRHAQSPAPAGAKLAARVDVEVALPMGAFGDEARTDLMQAWYPRDIPGRVELTVGKIDPFGFFDGNNIADDESERFLNLAFIHNLLLDAGGDKSAGDVTIPGLRAKASC